MAEIKIADKPTLDEVNAKAAIIQTGVGELKSDADRLQTGVETIHETAAAINTNTETVNTKIGADGDFSDSGGKTLFSLIKYIVSMFTSHFTSARAAKLDNLDTTLSSRAAQTSMDEVQSEVSALKSAINELKLGSGGVTVTIPSAKYVNSIDYYEQLPVVIEREGMAAFDVSGDIVYLVGGYNRAGQCDGGMFALRLSTGHLERLASMPTRRINAGIAFDKAAKVIYAVGGRDFRGIISDAVEAYSIAANTWVSLPNLPAPREGCRTVIHEGKLYCLGGRFGNARTVEMTAVLNLTANMWSELPPMAAPRFMFGAAVCGSVIMCMGGETQRGISKVHDLFSIRTNTWSSSPDMQRSRANFDIVMANGIQCCVGDWEGFSFFHIPAAKKWLDRQAWKTGAKAAGLERTDGVYTFGGRLPDGAIGAPVTKSMPGRMQLAPVEAGDVVWNSTELYTNTQRIQAQKQTVITQDSLLYSESDHEYGWIRKGGV